MRHFWVGASGAEKLRALGATGRRLRATLTVRAHMRLMRCFAVVLVSITPGGCTPSAPPEPIRTEIVEELPPTVCNLQKDDDGQEVVVIGTLHLDGLAIALEDPRCPAVRVDLTKETDAPVNFTGVGNGILVRLHGTYHRQPRNELDVAWIEPEAAFEKGTP